MNVERLHVIAKAIRQDIGATNVEALLSQLVNALTNQINQPGQPQHQQQVGSFREQLVAALDKAASNTFSPTWRQAADSIGATAVLGRTLADRVTEAFAGNQITPSVTLQKLQPILQELGTLRTALDQMIAAFQVLHIGTEDLAPGQCEIGVLVPRAHVDSRLPRFISELEEVHSILGVFSEVATGSRPELHINSLSSSDLTVYLASVPALGATVAVAVERIVALYKQLLEIRKLRSELAKQGVAEKDLQGVEHHANTMMTDGIEETVGELADKHLKGRDGGRVNELKIEMRIALAKIANRIDRGFNVEVRAGPPAAKSGEGQEASATDDTEHFSAIQEAGPTIQFMKLEGAPILSLPEGKEPARAKPAEPSAHEKAAHDGKKKEPK